MTSTRARTHALAVTGACVPGLVPAVTACMLDGAPAMRPGRSSHTQVAGFPKAGTQLNSWHSLVFESEEQQFPLRRGAHHPKAIESPSWGSPLFGIHLLQTGKYATI